MDTPPGSGATLALEPVSASAATTHVLAVTPLRRLNRQRCAPHKLRLRLLSVNVAVLDVKCQCDKSTTEDHHAFQETPTRNDPRGAYYYVRKRMCTKAGDEVKTIKRRKGHRGPRVELRTAGWQRQDSEVRAGTTAERAGEGEATDECPY
ncbi:hypothetical protein OH77DRAFT_1021752 [Trametes cingulata]|nr:hypothetical protein OH77DRAFT_1021752 [Trametes cingulata]